MMIMFVDGRKRKRCKHEENGKMCESSAEGATEFCKKHGGGKRCKHEENGKMCDASAQRATDFCIKHGGGKRCKHEENGKKCNASARGATEFCVKHGGGKRCKHEEDGKKCNASAQRATDFCKKHGGGKRCKHEENGKMCESSAEGATEFCKKHGGGKRCKHEENGKMCESSAVGATEFCKKHGGGKRCKHEENGKMCDASAQRATDFCIKHGGGKRCPNCINWIDSRSGKRNYDWYCATCFKRVFPEDPRSKIIYEHTKEIRVRNFINEHFEGFIHDKPMWISGCECVHRRRVDHRKLVGGVMLAIETDEFGHRGYDAYDEDIRYDDLVSYHTGKWVVIRFNPDGKGVDIEDKLDILKNTLDTLIERILNGDLDTSDQLLEVHKLFY